jgi:hypothetical protein
MQFDDVITFEHTKCKPLSIIMAIGAPERFILGLDVASMPANGKLAAISLKKYGKRKDERTKVRRELFQSLGSVVANGALIKRIFRAAGTVKSKDEKVASPVREN